MLLPVLPMDIQSLLTLTISDVRTSLDIEVPKQDLSAATSSYHRTSSAACRVKLMLILKFTMTSSLGSTLTSQLTPYIG